MRLAALFDSDDVSDGRRPGGSVFTTVWTHPRRRQPRRVAATCTAGVATSPAPAQPRGRAATRLLPQPQPGPPSAQPPRRGHPRWHRTAQLAMGVAHRGEVPKSPRAPCPPPQGDAAAGAAFAPGRARAARRRWLDRRRQQASSLRASTIDWPTAQWEEGGEAVVASSRLRGGDCRCWRPLVTFPCRPRMSPTTAPCSRGRGRCRCPSPRCRTQGGPEATAPLSTAPTPPAEQSRCQPGR